MKLKMQMLKKSNNDLIDALEKKGFNRVLVEQLLENIKKISFRNIQLKIDEPVFSKYGIWDAFLADDLISMSKPIVDIPQQRWNAFNNIGLKKATILDVCNFFGAITELIFFIW
ncbi:MAG TPA: hypothetical protein VLX68_17510 [Chitinivibrionales bacterium]|nr:hypothetical protein [Chitinivibrionales bacterium]